MPAGTRKRRNPLAHAVAMASAPAIAMSTPHTFAQDSSGAMLEEVVVTASRRSESVQDIPINISAVTGEKINELRLFGINEISRYVPGLQVIDRGPRDEVPDILVRGLNTTGLGPGFSSNTVATYFGDIPVAFDVKPVDLERVEVLIGPQGTLYGQGTMGGAIRYLPQRADSEEFSLDVRGVISQSGEADDFLNDAGFTVNLPIIKGQLALRANVDRLDDPGFIDYSFVVRESGASDPEPDFDNPDEVEANLRNAEDVNFEETLSIRVNLRWTPNDWLDASLWYLNQDTESGGRQISHELAFGTSFYESGLRYLEPNDYENELISLDVKADLGFAEAVFVYGETDFDELGQRDQTDLLLNFEYGYEAFPQFSSFTREVVEQETDTLEIRFVSQHDGPISWVAGYFQNELEAFNESREFTPGFDQFAVENFGGVQLRPDSLEYISRGFNSEKETAFYGEISYRMLDERLEFTVGYRAYEFEVDNTSGFGLPLFETVFLGEPQDSINIDLGTNVGDDDGDLIKLNASFDIDEDNMIYATYSEGYRNGGVNAVPACTDEQINSGTQQLCALPDEVFVDPDQIDNYELGYKGYLLEGAMSIQAALFYIDWTDLQVGTVTDFGSLPITGNGSAAESKGLEFQGSWALTSKLQATLTYAYTNAELVEDAPGLVGNFTALSGARLPGHAEHQGTFNIFYSTSLGEMDLDINYGFVYSSDVLNVTGGGDDPLVDSDGNPGDFGGEAIPSYDVHHLSATLSKDSWTLQAFVDNLLDEEYVTGTRTTRRFLQDERTGPGNNIGGFTLRSYGNFVGAPRTIGLRATYSF
ncbi:TonB-dependent receptor [Halioglobus sp. HI00S01]|uniref:TonB-dependent receptor n=1 Tax=Halioglobus sp. HI00S01 TaxID=1822214 RepID=UPI0007C2DBB4|nr:TonB-dependent receptor plug domain-containing protein [Halioglobus sp. HI00S01]KZX58360.1 TonB-dependent receptor [Halioglobus sp. HI00S01]